MDLVFCFFFLTFVEIAIGTVGEEAKLVLLLLPTASDSLLLLLLL